MIPMKIRLKGVEVMQLQLKRVEVIKSSKSKSDHVNPTGKVSMRDLPINRQIFHIMILMRMIVMRPKT